VAANRSLARLDASAGLVSNVELFVSMYIRKEALISSQIEGTQCNLDDVLDPVLTANTNADVTDVINYIKAAQFAINRLKTLPICSRLLKETHAILMEGVRGQEKYPGEYRRSQNWIGPPNCALKDARFIPPNVEDMANAISDLEKYINDTPKHDPLIEAAFIHYQFETIHPFIDGNGRIGRLLILLYLMEQKLLKKPVINISYFLKKNQVEYYDRITAVRKSGNYEQWVGFFLEAVDAAAVDAVESIEKLSALHDSNLAKLPKTNRTKDSVRMVFDYLEQHPIIDMKRTADALGVSYNTVSAAVKKLMKTGILKETRNAARNRVFAYEEYLQILRRGT
jgi:Fic family protein